MTGNYVYDVNGNLTYDPGKNMTIAYNYLGLPVSIMGKAIVYSYSRWDKFCEYTKKGI